MRKNMMEGKGECIIDGCGAPKQNHPSGAGERGNPLMQCNGGGCGRQLPGMCFSDCLASRAFPSQDTNPPSIVDWILNTPSVPSSSWPSAHSRCADRPRVFRIQAMAALSLIHGQPKGLVQTGWLWLDDVAADGWQTWGKWESMAGPSF